MSFKNKFIDALERMIPKENDDYIELQYSEKLYVQVWSHDNGSGSFEIYAIVPHDQVHKSVVGREGESQLSSDITGVSEFYEDIDEYVTEVTGKEYPNLVFYLMEVVDDGTWKRDASVYTTHELTV